MNEFEDQLREVLQRKQPSAGFTDTVVQRSRRKSPRWYLPAVASLAASLAAVLLYNGYEYRQGEYAKDQVLLALRIASEKGHVAQQKVDELNQRSILP